VLDPWIILLLHLQCLSVVVLSPSRHLITWSCQGQDMLGTSHPCGPTMIIHQDCTALITRKSSTDQGHTFMTPMTTCHLATTTPSMTHAGLSKEKIELYHMIIILIMVLAMTTIVATLTTIGAYMTTIVATLTTIGAYMTTIVATMTIIAAMTCLCLTTMAITSTTTMPTVAVLMCWEDGSITTGPMTLLTSGTTGPAVLLLAGSSIDISAPVAEQVVQEI